MHERRLPEEAQDLPYCCSATDVIRGKSIFLADAAPQRGRVWAGAPVQIAPCNGRPASSNRSMQFERLGSGLGTGNEAVVVWAGLPGRIAPCTGKPCRRARVRVGTTAAARLPAGLPHQIAPCNLKGWPLGLALASSKCNLKGWPLGLALAMKARWSGLAYLVESPHAQRGQALPARTCAQVPARTCARRNDGCSAAARAANSAAALNWRSMRAAAAQLAGLAATSGARSAAALYASNAPCRRKQVCVKDTTNLSWSQTLPKYPVPPAKGSRHA